ncbi:hypothetical protein HK102_011890, partial [Quaeritorhiza haematococci]
MHIQPGDILYLTKGQKFPVDAVLISTSYDDGTCFVETAELDGETNLKRRTALGELMHCQAPESVAGVRGKVQCEHPNENLTNFEGRLVFEGPIPAPVSKKEKEKKGNGNGKKGGKKEDDDAKEGAVGSPDSSASSLPNTPITTRASPIDGKTILPLGPNQLMLRGSVLRNTDYAFAIVLYTGPNTKIMKNLKQSEKNNGGGGAKTSTLERRLNMFTLGAFAYNLILLVTSVVLEVLPYQSMWSREQDAIKAGNNGSTIAGSPPSKYTQSGPAVQWYLGPVDTDRTYHTLGTILSFFSLYTYVIPISLFVSVELVRLVQGRFMMWDHKMMLKREYPVGSGIVKKYRMRANNTNLNEDLGGVEYVFSDKTGTLTQNDMRLAR